MLCRLGGRGPEQGSESAGRSVPMDVTYIPVLGVLRDLYAQPRGMERFRAYLDAMLGGTGDIALPITGANPMAKEHALREVERLLALGADEVAARAVRDAAARLAQIPGTLKTALVLMDDAMGGWTNRYQSEAADRFGAPPPAHRRIACGMAWTTEPATTEQITAEMLGTVYRVAHKDRHGHPTTLRAMLEQEGLTAVFAGLRPALGPAALAHARRVIAEYAAAAGEDDYPIAFACMYGDAAAQATGYPVLGLPPRAGFEVALADALERSASPVAALASGEGTTHGRGHAKTVAPGRARRGPRPRVRSASDGGGNGTSLRAVSST
jgi:hypothetical protein